MLMLPDQFPGDTLLPSQMSASKSVHLGDVLGLMHIHNFSICKGFCQ